MPNPNSKLMDVASQAFLAAEESPAEACRIFLKLFCAHNFGPAAQLWPLAESARCTTFHATFFAAKVAVSGLADHKNSGCFRLIGSPVLNAGCTSPNCSLCP